MTKPRLLDLFAGAGGAGEGYARAGFDVTGVDNRPMPRNPHRFIEADALDYCAAHGHEYDVIHASPPCQVHTSLKTMHNARQHADMISAVRASLETGGTPYIIENVPGAPLRDPVTVCGTMFGLGIESAELRRHRLFESNVMLMTPKCHLSQRNDVLGVYGGHVRNRRRTIGVYGEGVRDSRRKHDRGVPDFTIADGRKAMGIDWMTLAELCQAIPPAYCEFIGKQLLSVLVRQHAEVT